MNAHIKGCNVYAGTMAARRKFVYWKWGMSNELDYGNHRPGRPLSKYKRLLAGIRTLADKQRLLGLAQRRNR